MRNIKRHFILSMALAGAMFFSSCQGALEDDISDLFEIYSNAPSVSRLPSSGENNSNNKSDRALIGTWVNEKHNYVQGWRFYTNGKCCYGEWGNGDEEDWNTDDVMTYQASNGRLVVNIQYDDGDYDIEEFTYSISGSVLTLQGSDVGMSGSFTKR